MPIHLSLQSHARFVPGITRWGKKKKKTKLKGAGSLLQPNPMYRFVSISTDSHNRLHGAGQDIHTASGLSSSPAHIMLVSVSAAFWGYILMIGYGLESELQRAKGGLRFNLSSEFK